MENLEVKEAVDLAVNAGQALALKQGTVFAAGVAVGVVAQVIIPRAIKVVKNGLTKMASKRAAKKAAKLALKEQTEKE